MSGADEDLDAAARRKKRRALDIEAGLTWAALFGALPTQYSWNATKARKAGAEAFGRDQLGFTSRLDGRWYAWPSPQRLCRDFAGEHPGRSGMECYRKTVSDFRKKLRDLGTPYKPIVRSDRLAWARLQAQARQNSGRGPMTVPRQVQCASLRQHSFERESPWLRGSATTGPIRVPAVRDRGICVMASVDSSERASFFAHTLTVDMFDRSIGLMIGASTTQVQIGSPKNPVPGLADLAATTASQHHAGAQSLEIREAAAERAASGEPEVTPVGSRAGLLATLEWARRHQHHLVEAGPVSLTIAEGQSILPQMVALIDGWTAGSLAVAITLHPTGGCDEALLLTKTTWTFEAMPFAVPDPDTVVDPTHDMTTAEARILRRLIENA